MHANQIHRESEMVFLQLPLFFLSWLKITSARLAQGDFNGNTTREKGGMNLEGKFSRISANIHYAVGEFDSWFLPNIDDMCSRPIHIPSTREKCPLMNVSGENQRRTKSQNLFMPKLGTALTKRGSPSLRTVFLHSFTEWMISDEGVSPSNKGYARSNS